MDKFTLNKEQTVLMIIDIQEGLSPVIKNSEKVIHHTNILITAANKLSVPIITTEQYPQGLGSTVPELANRINPDYLFEKISFTAYTPEVEDLLEKFNRRKIIITGMETHVCVFQTVRDLLSKGYDVFIASDAISSRSNENYKNALDLMANMGAVISNTETILFDLLKKAGTPTFKELSQLIK